MQIHRHTPVAVTLLPCPFCGGEAEFVRRGTSRQSCIVNCTECGARHESADEGDSSGRTWNMRHADPDLARLRALGIEACDALTNAGNCLECRSDGAARRSWAKNAYATAERIRKELTR